MTSLAQSLTFHILLLATVGGEFLLPWVLKGFYKGYDSKTMAMSVLGSPQSPVRRVYNGWLLWLGAFLLLAAVTVGREMMAAAPVLGVLTILSVGTFALGAGILAGLFSVNEQKEKTTTASRIHGAGSAIGFMALLFFPLLRGLYGWRTGDGLQGSVCLAAFALALLFFVFFIMGDKEKFKGTVFSCEGLWERLTLAAMYIPFVYMALARMAG